MSKGKEAALEGLTIAAKEMDPALQEYVAHVSAHFGAINDLLANAPAALDARSVNLARGHLETSSLWIGNAINVLMFGLGAAHRKAGN